MERGLRGYPSLQSRLPSSPERYRLSELCCESEGERVGGRVDWDVHIGGLVDCLLLKESAFCPKIHV